jgi:hypothetical protein
MKFGHQHQDIIDIDLVLADQFNLKDDIVVDFFFVAFFVFCQILIQIDIKALVILEFTNSQQLIAFEIIKSSEDIFQTQDSTKQADEVFLILLADNRLAKRIVFLQYFNELGIARLMLAIFIKAIIVGLIVFQ